jgi:hypothetical protein
MLPEGLRRNECFQLISTDAAQLLRKGFKDKSLGLSALASAAGQILTASPLLVRYDTTGLTGKEGLALRNAFFSSMEIWSAATDGRLVFREHGNHIANVTVSLYDEESHDSPPGIASTRYGRRVIDAHRKAIVLHVDARIQISKQFVEDNWQAHSRLLGVCLHELGHVAGLCDGPPGGVMAEATHVRAEYPSWEEIQAISVITGACQHLVHTKVADVPSSAVGGQWPCRGFVVETTTDETAHAAPAAQVK